MRRIGYLIPEFPGQTHSFFWRELQSLAKLGVECDLLSTRLPRRSIISHSWSAEAMGRTTYLFPPTPARVATGIATILFAPKSWWRILYAIAAADVQGLKLRLRLFALALAGAQVATVAARRNWRHLHAHSCADSAHVAMFAYLIGGVPYSITLHGPLEDYGPNQAMKWSYAAFGIVITRKLLMDVRGQLDGNGPARIEVAPMGVTTDQFRRSSPYRPWDGRGSFEIFSCGRLNPCKGHDDLVRAVRLLRTNGIDAKLRIAGADDAIGQYQSLLQRLIVDSELQDSVTLLGAISEEAVRKRLEESHVFSLASLHEPLGVAIMEAMAMSLPVVVTRAGGVTELVDDGVDGILVDSRDPEGLARALQRVAQDPTLAAGLATAARAKVESSFRSDKSAEVLNQLIDTNVGARA